MVAWAEANPQKPVTLAGRFEGTDLALNYVSQIDGSTSGPLTEVGTHQPGMIKSSLDKAR